MSSGIGVEFSEPRSGRVEVDILTVCLIGSIVKSWSGIDRVVHESYVALCDEQRKASWLPPLEESGDNGRNVNSKYIPINQKVQHISFSILWSIAIPLGADQVLCYKTAGSQNTT